MSKNFKNTRENHPAWKGGKHITNRGYVRIYAPEHHRAKSSGYVLEHIIVMEEKLGKKIRFKDGEIHHLDKNRTNNDPNNLILVTAREHRVIHGAKEKAKRKRKPIKSYSWGDDKKPKEKIVPKEKLPKGYYYMKII